jgi:hypothetical protein
LRSGVKPFFAILGREIAERRLLFLGAAVAGLFPLLVPWFPGADRQDPAELRGGTALALAFVTSSLLALVLGSTIIAGDLGARRIGFYYARPLPAWALWAGKMLAAAFLCLGPGALVLLPALLAGGRFDVLGPIGFSEVLKKEYRFGPLAILGLLAAIALLLLVAGHAAGVMVRARSPWLALDFAGLGLVAALFWSGNQLLWREGAVDVLDWGGLGFAAAAFVAASLAGLSQVALGRTDLRRGHRVLSLTLWAGLGLAVAVHAAYVRWALAVTPDDLVRIAGIVPAPAGSWIVVQGTARGRGGYLPVFLLDTDSGRFVKLPPGTSNPWFGSLFSRDGSLALWREAIGGGAYELLTVDLRATQPRVRRTGLTYRGFGSYVLTPDGSRIAMVSGDAVSVDDLSSGRKLAAAVLPRVSFDALRFLDPGHVRILRSALVDEPGMPEVWRFTTFDLDVARHRLRVVSRIELPGGSGFATMSPDGKTALLVQGRGARVTRLADLETGRTSPLPRERDGFGFLPDGRLLVYPDKGPTVLGIATPEGAEQFRVSLPGTRLRVGPQMARDQLAVATTPGALHKDYAAWTTWLLDLRSRQLREIGRGMVPVFSWGAVSERLYLRSRGELLLFDPATGRRRTVLRGLAPTDGAVSVLQGWVVTR